MTLRELENFRVKMTNLEANNLKREGLSLEDAKEQAYQESRDFNTELLLYEILRELRRIK